MVKRLVIHPQTEETTPVDYIFYLRRVLRDIPEVSEVLLCGLAEFDPESGYTGIEISSVPLPPEQAFTAIALLLNTANDKTFSNVSEKIQNKFEADGLAGPIIFDGFKFPDIVTRLKKGKAIIAYERRRPVQLSSYHDLSKDLYQSLERQPSIWNGIAVYWFLWRTKEIIDVMRSDSSGRLHIHVSPDTNLVELSKRLLIVSDAITFWYAGPMPSLTVTNIPAPHPEDDVGKKLCSITGVGRPLPLSFGHLLSQGKSAFLSDRIFYSPLALLHAPPFARDADPPSLVGLSEWVKRIDHGHAPASDYSVKDIATSIGHEHWEKIQKRSSQFKPGPIVHGWQTLLRNGKYITLEKETWPLETLLQWEADITEFCRSPSHYSAWSSNVIDPKV